MGWEWPQGSEEVLLGYVLERFLYRLATSGGGGGHFVLKGGLLMAQFGARRMTRDIDILGRGFPGDEQEITTRIQRIGAVHLEDGVEFDTEAVRSVSIRDDEEYHGLRLSMHSVPTSCCAPCGPPRTRRISQSCLHRTAQSPSPLECASTRYAQAPPSFTRSREPITPSTRLASDGLGATT